MEKLAFILVKVIFPGEFKMPRESDILFGSFFSRLSVILLSLLLAVGIISFSGCNRSQEVGLNPGDFPPNFSLSTLSGTKDSLVAHKGEVVVLNFWATWCAPCVEEMPTLERLHSLLGSQGLTVLAVAVDDTEVALNAAQKELGLSFPILLDQNGKVRDQFKVQGYPETFIVDRSGKLVLFADPYDNEPKVRLVGPRDWVNPNVIARIQSILDSKKDKP